MNNGPLYRLFVPSQTVGANVVHFDLWLPAGGNRIDLVSVLPVVDASVAVTGLVGVSLFLTRTSAVGSGGTEATFQGTALDAATFSSHDGSQPLSPSQISARKTPSGGATAGAVLSQRCCFTEETAAAAYFSLPDMVRHGYSDLPAIAVPAGSGIRVVQSSVASVGTIGFDVMFRFISRD